MLKRRHEQKIFAARKLLKGHLVPMWCRKSLKLSQKEAQARAQQENTTRRRTRKKATILRMARLNIL
jgi:hypothetical protein